MKFIGYLYYYMRIKDEHKNIRYYCAKEKITQPISESAIKEILYNQEAIYETVYDCKIVEISFISEDQYNMYKQGEKNMKI